MIDYISRVKTAGLQPWYYFSSIYAIERMHKYELINSMEKYLVGCGPTTSQNSYKWIATI